jgi:pyridoxal biosynthesis lyase PdxS
VSKQDTEALRAEIARTRAELGQTIQALAERADVKSRVQHSVRRAGRTPMPWVALAAGAVAAVALLVLIRKRQR